MYEKCQRKLVCYLYSRGRAMPDWNGHSIELAQDAPTSLCSTLLCSAVTGGSSGVPVLFKIKDQRVNGFTASVSSSSLCATLSPSAIRRSDHCLPQCLGFSGESYKRCETAGSYKFRVPRVGSRNLHLHLRISRTMVYGHISLVEGASHPQGYPSSLSEPPHGPVGVGL